MPPVQPPSPCCIFFWSNEATKTAFATLRTRFSPENPPKSNPFRTQPRRVAHASASPFTTNADGHSFFSVHSAQRGFRAVHTFRPCQISACPVYVHS